ncbi:hypothetical protein DFH06DRAFT_1297027 [Mycena polygramma]|nr:hypothetical protein DFH06DRAFT_1297027 [Mycena polygramma]
MFGSTALFKLRQLLTSCLLLANKALSASFLFSLTSLRSPLPPSHSSRQSRSAVPSPTSAIVAIIPPLLRKDKESVWSETLRFEVRRTVLLSDLGDGGGLSLQPLPPSGHAVRRPLLAGCRVRPVATVTLLPPLGVHPWHATPLDSGLLVACSVPPVSWWCLHLSPRVGRASGKHTWPQTRCSGKFGKKDRDAGVPRIITGFGAYV